MRFPRPTTKSKGGQSLAFPDVCKTPAPPAPFVPVPYPNIAQISGNMKAVPIKIKGLEKQFDKVRSSGDEAGTLKGVVSASTSKLKSLFKTHSISVKVTGKKASQIMSPTMGSKASKLYKQAQKQQKAFEKAVQKECDKLTKACKGNPEQEKIAKKIVDLVGKAARGHKV